MFIYQNRLPRRDIPTGSFQGRSCGVEALLDGNEGLARRAGRVLGGLQIGLRGLHLRLRSAHLSLGLASLLGGGLGCPGVGDGLSELLLGQFVVVLRLRLGPSLAIPTSGLPPLRTDMIEPELVTPTAPDRSTSPKPL